MYLGSNEIVSRYLGSNEIVASYLGDKEIYSSIIPPSLKPNVLAWWDAGQKKDVMYGLNQLVTNGDFHDGTAGWSFGNVGDYSVADNTLTFVATAQFAYASNNISFTYGHKYFATTLLKASSSNVRFAIIGDVTNISIGHSGSNLFERLSIVYSPTIDTSMKVNIGDNRDADWTTISAKNIIIFDLTAIFGADNEPTATEFQEILTADGNQYWEGVRNVKCNPDNKYYWYDYSGNGRHMKLNNFAYTSGSGWVDTAPKHLKGDGVDDWVGRAESGFIAEDADFSCMCVFSPSADGATTYLSIGLNVSFISDIVIYVYFSSGNITTIIYDRVSGVKVASYAISALSSTYYIITSTYSQDRKARLYVNGLLVLTTTELTNGHKAINYVSNFRSANGSIYTAQKLGTETYFNKALTADEVKALYNANCTRYGLAKI